MMRAMLMTHLMRAGAASVLLATAATAAAQTAVPKGGKKPAGPLLTRAELRACFAQRDLIRDRNEALVRERAELDKERSELVALGDSLKSRLETMDRADPMAVSLYNADAGERDRRIDAFEARMPPFNERAEALARERESWSRRCDNRHYDELDEIAIRRGK
jgi:hypothetical protein